MATFSGSGSLSGQAAFTFVSAGVSGLFVSIANSSTDVAVSTDAITWTLGTLPASNYWRSITNSFA